MDANFMSNLILRSTGLVLALMLLVPIHTDAGPLDWAKHHKRFLLMEGTAIAGASVHAYGLRHRRHGDVERCDEGYGAAWGMFGFTTRLTVIALPAAAESCWKHDGGKVCWGLAYGGSVAQGSWGIHEARIPVKPDLSDVQIK